MWPNKVQVGVDNTSQFIVVDGEFLKKQGFNVEHVDKNERIVVNVVKFKKLISELYKKKG